MGNAFWLNHNLEQTKAISSISKLPEHHRVFNVTNNRDTAAKAAAQNGSWLLGSLLRLWIVTLVVNLIGGFLFAFAFAVDGDPPSGSAHALSRTAEEFVHRLMGGMFARAIIGGVLVSLLSFLI
ncbi:formate/nitrite transporter family protein [Saliphagus sp. GCM10025308]